MRSLLAVLLVGLAGLACGVDLGDATLNGFLDVRGGLRTREDPVEPDASLAEVRGQTSLERIGEASTLTLRTDFLYDHVPRDFSLDLETGEGPIDLREASLLMSPADSVDLKVGRQILTWGVGDLLFVNDLFPKDWQSFFSGRDTEYLKAPSDALLLSAYPGSVNLDLVYTPRFDADRFISGDRISYWNPMLGATAGRNAIAHPDERDDWFREDEWAGRIRRSFGAFELAGYGYDGYWKSPEGVVPTGSRPYFPRLSVYGASGRGPAAGGIVSAEAGYYDSREDRDGDDPGVPNSQHRLLAGYERELMRDLQIGVQYYVEWMMQHDNYLDSLPAGYRSRDEDRHVVALRLTRLAMNQNLTLSLFGYFSPTDQDAYIRPYVQYKMTDDLMLAAGANLFAGRHPHTFFGQFEDNTNVYGAVRYLF